MVNQRREKSPNAALYQLQTSDLRRNTILLVFSGLIFTHPCVHPLNSKSSGEKVMNQVLLATVPELANTGEHTLSLQYTEKHPSPKQKWIFGARHG